MVMISLPRESQLSPGRHFNAPSCISIQTGNQEKVTDRELRRIDGSSSTTLLSSIFHKRLHVGGFALLAQNINEIGQRLRNGWMALPIMFTADNQGLAKLLFSLRPTLLCLKDQTQSVDGGCY